MKIIKYELLLAAVKHGSVSEAAAEFYYSQPGVTNMLNSLEKELGVRLLDRKRGRVQLTAEGEQVYPDIQKLVEYHRSILKSIHEMKDPAKTRVLVGASYSILSLYFRQTIHFLRENHPELDIWLRIDCCSDLLEWMKNGEVQVALMPLMGMRGYVEVPLEKDKIVAVCGKDVACSLSEDRPVTKKELEEVLAAESRRREPSPDGNLFSRSEWPDLSIMDDRDGRRTSWRNLEPTLVLRQFAKSGEICESVRTFELEGSPEVVIGAVYREVDKESAAIRAFVDSLQ